MKISFPKIQFITENVPHNIKLRVDISYLQNLFRKNFHVTVSLQKL